MTKYIEHTQAAKITQFVLREETLQSPLFIEAVNGHDTTRPLPWSDVSVQGNLQGGYQISYRFCGAMNVEIGSARLIIEIRAILDHHSCKESNAYALKEVQCSTYCIEGRAALPQPGAFLTESQTIQTLPKGIVFDKAIAVDAYGREMQLSPDIVVSRQREIQPD